MRYVVQISSGFGSIIYGVIDKKELDEEWFPGFSSIVLLDLFHHTID